MNLSLRQLLLATLLTASMIIWGITAYLNYKLTCNEVTDLLNAELAQSAKVLDTFVEGLLHGEPLAVHWKNDQSDAEIDDLDLDYKYSKAKKTNSTHSHLISSSPNHPDSSDSNMGSNMGSKQLSESLWDIFDGMVPTDPFSHKYERKIAFQLWSKSDELMLRSDSAPKFAFSSSIHGFSETTIDGHLWHVFSITNSDGEYVIHVGQKEEVRNQLTTEITKQLGSQFLVGVPILGIVIWLIVGFYLKPISLLERALAKREANFLKPLSIKKLPKEIVPVVNEMNSLFKQLEQALEHERRFTADASHELRTPLAGLLTQAQVALKTNDDEVRKQALKRIEQAVNRMTYMVQQLLTFSRIESNSEFLNKSPTLISYEIVQTIADLEKEAHRKRIRMEFEEKTKTIIIVNPPLINILIRNLIDNAIKYTPHDGIIRVSILEQDNAFKLCVEDSGPGIPPEQYANSLKRFHRGIETAQQAQGSGLGFSIVLRIVAIHDATMALGTSRFGGLKVTVTFPLPIDKTKPIKTGFFNIKRSA
jgi:two-component system sensor histidine kinase QseC